MSDESKKNSQEYAIDFIKAFADTEAEILPYREHLTKQELRMAVKAYRMLKSDEDIEQLTSFYEKISRSV